MLDWIDLCEFKQVLQPIWMSVGRRKQGGFEGIRRDRCAGAAIESVLIISGLRPTEIHWEVCQNEKAIWRVLVWRVFTAVDFWRHCVGSCHVGNCVSYVCEQSSRLKLAGMDMFL